MRLLVTTILRHAPPGVPSGFASVLELPSGEIVSRSAAPDSPWRRRDPNPRGGLRGAKGISFCGERLALASTDCVYVFDRRWRLQRAISHPLAAGLHDV